MSPSQPRQCRIALLFCAVTLLGCASPTQRIDHEAQRAGLTRSIVEGTSFRHVIYVRVTESVGTLTVFLEGDGLPWIGGRIPAEDPTSRDPLALRLMIRSRGAALYVGRPCYHEVRDAGCSARAWTFDRYSSTTVESMAACIKTKAQQLGATDIELIGYSGGGVLAVLIAERLNNVSSVVTIAANLDVDAWTTHHGYLALDGSLNPARSSFEHPWRELHLAGARDERVPIETTRAYFERYPRAQQITFDDYDHVCCWVEELESVRSRAGVAAKKELEKSR